MVAALTFVAPAEPQHILPSIISHSRLAPFGVDKRSYCGAPLPTNLTTINADSVGEFPLRVLVK